LIHHLTRAHEAPSSFVRPLGPALRPTSVARDIEDLDGCSIDDVQSPPGSIANCWIRSGGTSPAPTAITRIVEKVLNSKKRSETETSMLTEPA